MDVKKYLFFYVFLSLAIGIYCSDRLNAATNLRIYFFSLLFLLMFSILIRTLPYKTLGFMGAFAIIGLLRHQHFNEKVTRVDLSKEKERIHYLLIDKALKPTAQYQKYIAQDIYSQQSVLLYLPHSSHHYPKDEIIVYGQLVPTPKALNPYQFDYRQYLKQQRIHAQMFCHSFVVEVGKGKGWKNTVARSKKHIQNRLLVQGYSAETRGLIGAMLLGDRAELSDSLYTSYRDTGVVHILAISGLHVVLIFGIIYYLLYPLRWLIGNNRTRILISLLIIWGFAFYVELVPSVFRASLMLSIYYFSGLLHRPRNIYHSLSLAGCILLLLNPNHLFGVGFLLSFSAVFFIAWLYPAFDYMWKGKNRVLRRIYELCATTTAAQLGTMPLTVYSFHQFPGLFLAGNLFMIPASIFILSGSMVSIVLTLLALNVSLWVTLFNGFIYLMNAYIHWLSEREGFIFKQLIISPLSVVVLYIALYYVRFMVIHRSKKALFMVSLTLLFLQLERTWSLYTIRTSNELVIFHRSKETVIGVRSGETINIFSTLSTDTTALAYTIGPYIDYNRIGSVAYYNLEDTLYHSKYIKTKSFIQTDEFRLYLGSYPQVLDTTADIILLRNSALKPEKLPQKRVIADASNYPSYINYLDSISHLSLSLLWKTADEGAYRIKF